MATNNRQQLELPVLLTARDCPIGMLNKKALHEYSKSNCCMSKSFVIKEARWHQWLKVVGVVVMMLNGRSL